MTTLAFDGRYAAVDSQTTDTGSDIKFLRQKGHIVDLDDGTQAFVAGCGDYGAIHAATAALCALEAPPKGNYTLLVCPLGGDPYELDQHGPVPVAGFDYWAAGSGGSAALGALHAGVGAAKAVEIACKIDLYSGGPVTVFDTRTKKLVRPPSRRSKTSQ